MRCRATINEQSYKIKQVLISNLFSRPPPKTTIVPTIADSGTTHTYIRLQDVINKNTLPTRNPIYVILPSNKHISSSHTTTINFPGLSDNAKNAHVLQELKSRSILSIGQLYDDNCIAIFSKTNST